MQLCFTIRDGNTSVKDYAYDANVNMIADLNKRISSITSSIPNIIFLYSELFKMGLTVEWVTEQLGLYTKAIEQGGDKLKNAQLPYRKELMEKYYHYGIRYINK
ncbi:hypothetical protein [Chitinophaga rhizophila]|uniref:Virulence RhuM family protein n=1 Tax=Chitinophaga rhizophila TaxID=2866212 RepID=A0ABS7GAL7_9BACT|nr:hypothetical protein [Chitinophaga rhizophila]MBW8684709.1 hypothetical protein [Chitinophaga rhizophila]